MLREAVVVMTLTCVPGTGAGAGAGWGPILLSSHEHITSAPLLMIMPNISFKLFMILSFFEDCTV